VIWVTELTKIDARRGRGSIAEHYRTEREDQFDIEFFDVTDRRGKGLALR
jgi:hypothetical protein